MTGFREEYEKKYTPMWEAMKKVSENEHNKLVELCQRNCWVKWHGLSFEGDPYLELDSPYAFCRFEDISLLKLFFEHGNWSIRQGVLYRDLFFCNQVNGGDEWWTCRYEHKNGMYIPFESISFRTVIKRGYFNELINGMLEATVEECKQLEITKNSMEHKGGKV